MVNKPPNFPKRGPIIEESIEATVPAQELIDAMNDRQKASALMERYGWNEEEFSQRTNRLKNLIASGISSDKLQLKLKMCS